MNKIVKVGKLAIANNLPFTLIAGPCQIESQDHCFSIAEKLVEICGRLNIGLIFKSSYDKANRTSSKAGRGIGIDEGLKILGDIQTQFSVPVLTDVHDEHQCAVVGSVVDVIQIQPSCRARRIY